MLETNIRTNQAKLLTEGAAAKTLSCSAALLRKWRRTGEGPRYCKIGSLVRYSEADIADYVTAHRVEVPRLRTCAAEVPVLMRQMEERHDVDGVV